MTTLFPSRLRNAERSQPFPFDEAGYLKDLGVTAGWGETGFTTVERRWARPTCDVNGLFGGYSGPGPKTIGASPRHGENYLPANL